MAFLTAQWKHLLMANFCVDRELLRGFVPDQTSIDDFDGNTFVSLVAFLFDNTRVIGIPVPFHRRFEEVNLRFYVAPDKDKSTRAVTFIKEIVPKRIIPFIANSLFHENYAAVPMDHGANYPTFWYSWGESGKNRFSARIDSELAFPAPGSMEEFITEHYWGYAQGPTATLEYRVTHPQWKCCSVKEFDISVDFSESYGEPFAFLSSQKPYNVLYAQGSAVTVSFPKRI